MGESSKDCFDQYWQDHPDEVPLEMMNNFPSLFPGGFHRPLAEDQHCMDAPFQIASHPSTFSHFYTFRSVFQLIDTILEQEGWPTGRQIEHNQAEAIQDERIKDIMVRTYRRLRAFGFGHLDLIT